MNRKSDHPVKGDIFLDKQWIYLLILKVHLFMEKVCWAGAFLQLLWRLGHEETHKISGGNFINNKKCSNSSVMKQETNAGIQSSCCARYPRRIITILSL